MPRTREFDPEEALDAAMHMFWEKGYADTSMRELFACTGVAPAGLYSVFGGKRGLYEKALEHYRDKYFSRMIEEVLRDDADIADIVLIFERLRDRMQSNKRGIGCLWTNGAMEFGRNDSGLSDLFRWNADRMQRRFVEILSRAQAQRALSDTMDPTQTAALLVTLYNGILVLARGSADKALIDQAVDSAVSQLTAERA